MFSKGDFEKCTTAHLVTTQVVVRLLMSRFCYTKLISVIRPASSIDYLQEVQPT